MVRVLDSSGKSDVDESRLFLDSSGKSVLDESRFWGLVLRLRVRGADE